MDILWEGGNQYVQNPYSTYFFGKEYIYFPLFITINTVFARIESRTFAVKDVERTGH